MISSLSMTSLMSLETLLCDSSTVGSSILTLFSVVATLVSSVVAISELGDADEHDDEVDDDEDVDEYEERGGVNDEDEVKFKSGSLPTSTSLIVTLSQFSLRLEFGGDRDTLSICSSFVFTVSLLLAPLRGLSASIVTAAGVVVVSSGIVEVPDLAELSNLASFKYLTKCSSQKLAIKFLSLKARSSWFSANSWTEFDLLRSSSTFAVITGGSISASGGVAVRDLVVLLSLLIRIKMLYILPRPKNCFNFFFLFKKKSTQIDKMWCLS